MAKSDASPLPQLRRKRRVNVPAIVGRFSPGVAAIDAQTETFHRLWDDHNAIALDQGGPLWVALGDSSSQGVGADDWAQGWTLKVLERIRAQTAQPWRLINLSMSGGRFADVADRQMPVLNTLLPKPDLITCVIGSNDLMWRRGTTAVYRDAQHCVDRLPPETWLSKLNGPGARPAALNEIFETGARDRDLNLFNIWRWPSGHKAMAADRVHPSTVGYDHMATLAWDAVARTVGAEQ